MTKSKLNAIKLYSYIYYNLFCENKTHRFSTEKKALFDDPKKFLRNPKTYTIKHFFNLIKKIGDFFQPANNLSKWQNAFIDFILSLNYEMYKNLLFFLPKEILDKNIEELKNYKGITPFEMSALACEDIKNILKNHEKRELKLERPTDCWYDSDLPDAKCCHVQRKEICPITIIPSLSSNGIIMHPKETDIDLEEIKINHYSILENINKHFDPICFSNDPSLPISVGMVENEIEFSRWNLKVQPQNLPIKMPFTDYRVPIELSQFSEFIQKVADYWHSINTEYSDYYYCYFSVAQSEVPPGCFQRRGHLHSDGFQSAWIKPKLFSDFTFIASDTASTEFYLQNFDVSKLSPAKDNYYKYFVKNLNVKPLRLRKPYEIIAMDTYTLHKSVRNETSKPIPRTFVRIMYSVIRWFSQNNAHNPMFNYEWPKMNRTLLNKLQ